MIKRGTFIDLQQMTRREFAQWWRARMHELGRIADGMTLIADDYDGSLQCVALTMGTEGSTDARRWWHGETDGECCIVEFTWSYDRMKWEEVQQ